jgi:hypothetical protein
VDQYVNDYIPLLSGIGQRRALDILQDARVTQTDVEALVNNLVVKSDLRSLVLRKDEFLSKIRADNINGSFHNVFSEFSDLYNESNRISTIISSYADVLNSEISSLNKEIDVIEKSIRNYAFLLTDAKAYNHSFLEPFSDKSFVDNVDFTMTDRSGIDYQTFEQASINTTDGTLVISGNLKRNFSLSPDIIASNFTAITETVTDDTTDAAGKILDSVSKDTSKSWTLIAKTPMPLTAIPEQFQGIDGSEKGGALIAIDYELSQAAPCDTITIDPTVGGNFELLQATVYYSDATGTTKNLLIEPLKVEQKTSLYFELKPIKKIRCFFRQGLYVRKQGNKLGLGTPIRPVVKQVEKNLSHKIDKRLIHEDMLPSTKNNTSGSISRFSFDVTPDGTVPNMQFSRDMRNESSTSFLSDTAASNSNIHGMNLFYTDLVDSSGRADISNDYRPEDENARIANSKELSNAGDSSSMQYTYTFGIKNIAIGSSVDKTRSIYISKKLPAPGDTGEVRLNAGYIDSLDPSLDNPYITSVEFSVTNVSKPNKESDWIPILPSGQTQIESERLFFDNIGFARFRFKPSYEDNILIYKNGLSFILERHGKFVTNGRNEIIGIYINPIYYTSRDIFTCYYAPAGDASLVNFEAAGFEIPPLVSAYDSDGPGEGFNSTANQTSIRVSNEVFVDYAQAKAAEYSATYGMIGYSPITIRLEDGTLAYNLTNYIAPQEQAQLNPDSQNITFLHSANNIIFNRPLAGKFRVFYQYLPSTVRVRVILRTNTKQFATPKVDFYQIKSKIRLANSINSI